MLRSICPYGIRGFWYYQGEQDEEWPQDYQAELTQLVRCWRRCWDDAAGSLPFLLVQLPMYATGAGPDSWPLLRQAQARVAADEPNAGLVVLADCGEADNIHPVDKEPAGRRLALLALETVYGQPVAGRSPQLLEARGRSCSALPTTPAGCRCGAAACSWRGRTASFGTPRPPRPAPTESWPAAAPSGTPLRLVQLRPRRPVRRHGPARSALWAPYAQRLTPGRT